MMQRLRLVKEVRIPDNTVKTFWLVWGTAFVCKVALIITMALGATPERQERLQSQHGIEQSSQTKVCPYSGARGSQP